MIQKRNFMKQAAALILLSAFSITAQCGKTDNADSGNVSSEELGNRYAKYAIALYSNPGSTAPADWVITLAKTEKVSVLETTNVDGPKGAVVYLKVRAVGNKTGYAEERHFAEDIGVITTDSPKLLSRPIITGTKGYNADALIQGTIVFIEEQVNETEDWYKITGSAKGVFFNGYIRGSDVSTDYATVTDAALLEKAVTQLQSGKPADIKEGRKALEELTSSDSPVIAGLATKALEDPPEEKEDEPAQNQPAAPAPPPAPVSG